MGNAPIYAVPSEDIWALKAPQNLSTGGNPKAGVTESTIISDDNPVTGSGTLATIRFRCKAQGTAVIAFENPVPEQDPVKLADNQANPIACTWQEGEIQQVSVLDGDANGNGKIDIFDMVLIGQHWGETGSPGWIPADVTADGAIDIFDMTMVGQNWTG